MGLLFLLKHAHVVSYCLVVVAADPPAATATTTITVMYVLVLVVLWTLRSFGALAIFRNLCLMIRDHSRIYFEWL